ncbi:MAG TPA: ABC transporter permease [Methanocella sp.]|uniref:ABC transporter permease n=1 Tax=Methanocella sp. TaxID=2052833 RepID=UPI002BDAB7F3|nr:ABC transporter permease [Methanocella sp.]HTY91765.1 ABC transporter permease [Methanocella sp.]
MSRIVSDVKYSLIAYFRNKGALFWTLIFPIILFLLMGYLFGGQSGPLELYYQDSDGSQLSHSFVGALNQTGVFDLRDGAGMDLAQSLKDGKISAYIVIPSGFEKSAMAAKAGSNVSNAGLEVYYDKSKSTSGIVISVIEQVVNGMNMALAGARNVIPVTSQDVTTSSMSFVAFLLPGIIGMTIMSSAVNGTVSTTARNKATGVFRKLATTPISRLEWNAAKIINQTIILMLSISISLIVAWLVFGIVPNINAVSVLMIIFGSAVFSGLGMLITTFVKDVDSAENAASAITFPLMFVSGSFISVDSMPWFLRYLADVSPLTYLNNGLRSSMITGNYGDAVMNLIIVAILGIILFVVGVSLLKWKED